MRRPVAVALLLIGVLLLVAAISGGGSWLIQKVQVMHGIH